MSIRKKTLLMIALASFATILLLYFNISRILMDSYLELEKQDTIKSVIQVLNKIVDIEDIYLGIDVSIPCGLFINELISNSLKHAFNTSNNTNHSINITEHGYKENNNYVLTYSDKGVGIPEHINAETTNTLGLQLIYGFAQQIKGKIELDRSQGTKYTIKFSDER